MTKLEKNKQGPEEFIEFHEPATEKPNLNGDWINVFILIVLYVIQGFPKGLTIGFSIILQSRKLVNYDDQAALSVALWPQWMKILWAPILDASYIQWIGRRKCWLLLLQLLMGLLLLFMANNMDDWLPDIGKPNLKMITSIIFLINILSATQDIVVDGWALTILKKKNVSYSSTCNIVGVVFGIFIASVGFVLLVSEDFNNKYFQTTPGTGGLTTIKTFIYTWAILILTVTVLIGVFKKEKDGKLEDDYVKLNVVQSYKLLWDILKLPRIKMLAVVLMTMRIGFISMESSISNLKLIDAGISKDDMMMIGVLNCAITLITPLLASKYITSSKPMNYYMKITPFRLLWAVTYAALIYFTPTLIRKHEVVNVPTYYYVILGSIFSINEIMSIFMMLLVFSLFCRISDPRFGGTYMTLFNTFYFLGYLVSNTLALKLIAIFTFSKCSNDMNNSCSTPDLKNLCQKNEGSCEVYIDGYYTTIILNMVIGFVWYSFFRKIIKEYEFLSLSEWLINVKQYKTTKTNDNRTIP